MQVHTHASSWRTLLVWAAPLAVALAVAVFIQGEHGIFRFPPLQLALIGLAALGLLVSLWTARRLAQTPDISIAEARPGPVAMHGTAKALPGAPPLVSPYGAACLWFTHSERVMHKFSAWDSVRPFLLVDERGGECVVLPAGAEIAGSSKITEARSVKLSAPTDITGHGGSADYGMGERLLCEGDVLHVSGWFTPASAEAIELQTQAAELNATVERPSIVIRSSEATSIREPMAALPPELPPAPPPMPPVALPVVSRHGAQPFVLHIGTVDNDAALYWVSAIVNGLVLFLGACLFLFVAAAPSI